MKRIVPGYLPDDSCSDYLRDSSLLQGRADEIVLCSSSRDVIDIVGECSRKHLQITIQGAMTGICGGGVPDGGWVINLSQMKGITGMTYDEDREEFHLKVEPGLLLTDLNALLKSRTIDTRLWSSADINAYEKFRRAPAKFFPPDPTESTASIGGMAACDASGACSFKYGSTRNFIEGIRLVTPRNGEISIKRGQYSYRDMSLIFDSGIPLPGLQNRPELRKDVAGLYCKDEMDLIDLFIGSEGLLGVITEIELKLVDAPKIRMGLMLFLNEDCRLAVFVDWLRNEMDAVAVEFFDKNTLELLRSFREIKREIGSLPDVSDKYHGGLYLEFHLSDERQLDEVLASLLDSLNGFGINDDEQWLALESSDFEKLKDFRHAVPECVNTLIADRKRLAPEINKVGTDMAVPDSHLDEVMRMYVEDIESANLKSIIFGHIGDNHLHVNLIPDDLEDYYKALALVKSWAERVVLWGGTVTAEHGIGRLKNELLTRMISRDDLESMKMIKRIIDPDGLLNEGVLF